MNTLKTFVLGVMALSLAVAQPAQGQGLWFNGVGLSGGGGQMRFTGTTVTPVATVIGPQGNHGAVVGGLTLTLGTRRWALLLPDFHAYRGSAGEQRVPGVLTVNGASAPFETTGRSVDVLVLTAGGQVALVPSGRVWARGGIGAGSLASSLQSEEGVAIDLTEDLGLALSAGAGVRLWAKETGSGERFHSLNLEMQYLRVRGDTLRVALPSVRLGWHVQFIPLHR